MGLTSEDVFAGGSSYRTDTLRAQSAIGVSLHRQTFELANIERDGLAYFDDYVAKAAEHRMRLLPILFRTGRPACPRDLRSIARLAQTLVRRYGPSGSLWRERPGVPKVPIRAWQLWNEPNLRVYWCNRPSARAYARMLRVVGGAIKRVDRGAEIVTAGLPPSKLRGAVPLGRYIRQLYRAGGRRYFRTLAINSYARNHRELGRLLRSVRRLMNSRGHRRGRIWITEIGWGDRGPRHRFIVGARGQASRISRALAYISRNRRRLRLRGFVYFCWRDAPPYPPLYQDLWGLHTGLLDREGRPKPAYNAFKRGVQRIR